MLDRFTTLEWGILVSLGIVIVLNTVEIAQGNFTSPRLVAILASSAAAIQTLTAANYRRQRDEWMGGR